MSIHFNIKTVNYCYASDYDYYAVTVGLLTLPYSSTWLQFMYTCFFSDDPVVVFMYLGSMFIYLVTYGLASAAQYPFLDTHCYNALLNPYTFPSVEIAYINTIAVFMYSYNLINIDPGKRRSIYNGYGVGLKNTLFFFLLTIVYSGAYYLSNASSFVNICITYFYSIVFAIVMFYWCCLMGKWYADMRDSAKLSVFQTKFE